MKILKLCIISILLLVLISTAYSQNYDFNLDFGANLGYRQGNTYNVNGQNQTVIMDQHWGAIVCMPELMKNPKLERNFNSTSIVTDDGKVTITREEADLLTITYPEGKITIQESDNGGTVTFMGNDYEAEIWSRNELNMQVPDGKLKYKSTATSLSISGAKGDVTYKKDPNGFTITSDAGSTKYKAALDGKYTIEGVPMNDHPYGYWGIEFYLPKYHVGVIVEFNRLINMPTFPRGLDLKAFVIKK
ncbi:MAG: hypothetical protein K8T10_06175 [Candidatus Eremiobacteraeota bacterium]|nr:hypothetical protein [Candidatus Eremiobacteraeota bacterium]